MRSGSFSLRVLITARCGFTVGVAFTPYFVGLGANRFSAINVDSADFFTLKGYNHWVGRAALRGEPSSRGTGCRLPNESGATLVSLAYPRLSSAALSGL